MVNAKKITPVIKGDLLTSDATILTELVTRLGDGWGYNKTTSEITLFKIE